MRKALVGLIGLTGSLACLAPPASASNSDGCSAYSSGGSVSYYDCGSSPTSSSPDKTSNETTRGSAGAVSAAIGNRVAGAMKAAGGAGAVAMAETGVSAGDAGIDQALWASFGAASLSNSIPGAAFSGTLSNQTAGYDFMVNERTIAGLSVFHEGNSFRTDFNSGKLDADAWWMVPYVGHDFGQGSTIDAMLGLAYVDGKASRAAGAATGSYDGYRTMSAINVHHNLDLGGDWRLRGDLGLLGAYSRTNGYDEKGAAAQHQSSSTSHLMQAKVGGRASYLWGAVEPFASAYYAYDLVADRAGDDGIAPGGSGDADEFQFYGGLDWYPTDTESVGFELSKVVGRDRSQSMGVLMNARLRF